LSGSEQRQFDKRAALRAALFAWRFRLSRLDLAADSAGRGIVAALIRDDEWLRRSTI
jgi:hypothetical protein